MEFKGHQNWVNISGEHLVFPGGGTQFKYGALHYIDFIQEVLQFNCTTIPQNVPSKFHNLCVLDLG